MMFGFMMPRRSGKSWAMRLYQGYRSLEQQQAIRDLAALNLIPEQTGDTPEYDQEPTRPRQTTTDTWFEDFLERFNTVIRTTNTTIKENPMPALHNRALALKLAVEAYGASGMNLLDDAPEAVDGVIALADRFVAYLGADEPNTTGAVPSGDTATTPAAPRKTTATAVEEIRVILERKTADFGGRTVGIALDQLPALNRIATYEGALNAAVIELAGGDARRELGAAFAAAVTADIEALQRA